MMEGFDEEFAMDFMGGMMREASSAIQAEQKTALELTKLALGCIDSPGVDEVFDLFERAAHVVSEVYPSPFNEG